MFFFFSEALSLSSVGMLPALWYMLGVELCDSSGRSACCIALTKHGIRHVFVLCVYIFLLFNMLVVGCF